MNIFKNIFHKYNITIDKGPFDIITIPIHKSRSGKTIMIERISEIQNNMINPAILIIHNNGNREYAEPINNIIRHTSYDSLWKFIMPNDDVKLVPIAHRKIKSFL